MSDTLNFECPHCREVITVPAGKLGQQQDCPRCGKPFQSRAPLAREIPEPGSPPLASRNNVEQTLLTLHPVMFRNHIVTLLVVWLVGLASAAGIVAGFAGMAPALVAGLVGLAAVAVYCVYAWVGTLAVTLTITTQRSIIQRGLISRSTSEVQHDDVRNIQCDQNVIERMLNYGDIALSSAGQDEMEIVIHDIPGPQRVIDLIRQQQ